ncbi:hypothetical protein JL721_540 [Aureococcus anophagefferens]|nr:hypothetical protein JL721_540 [Aureococcus anophagefferens]
MALVVAAPPTLTAVAWEQSDDREAIYEKLVAILSEAPSETCSLLSYEHDSEPEERLAAEAAEARALEAYAPCLVGAALRDLRDAGAAHAARRRGARALAAACRVAGARPGSRRAARGPRRSAAVRAGRRPRAAARGAPPPTLPPRSSSVADLARRGPRARARRLRRRGRAAVRGGRRGGLRRGGRGAKRCGDPLPVFRDRVGVATGLVKVLSKCKTAVQRYAAHDDTAPGDDAAAACLGSFFGAWAAVYACMRASDAPRRAKFLKSQGAMIAKPYKACFAGVPGVREAVLVLVGDAAAAGRLGAVLGSFGGAGVVEACARARAGRPRRRPRRLRGRAGARRRVGARGRRRAPRAPPRAAAAFQRVLDRDVDGAALDAARALALAPRADDDDGLFDAYVRARYGAPEDLRALATEARAAKLGACLEAELLEPALAGARGLEPDLLLAFWTAATRGRRADAPPAALCAWPALHALAIKDGAWLDASLSRQRLDELARLAADAASAVELLGELDARHAARDADPTSARGCGRRRGPRDALADAAGADGLPAAARVCARRPSPERPPPESPKRRKFVAPDKDRPHAFGDCVVQSRSAAGPTTTKKKHDDEGRLRAARALLESQHSESQSQDSEPQKRASVLCYTSLASSQGPDLPGAWAAKFDASQRPSPEDA